MLILSYTHFNNVTSVHLFIFVLILICACLVNLYWFLLLINYRLQYEGAPKYLGASVTAVGIGIQNSLSSPCEAILVVGWGCLQMCR